MKTFAITVLEDPILKVKIFTIANQDKSAVVDSIKFRLWDQNLNWDLVIDYPTKRNDIREKFSGFPFYNSRIMAGCEALYRQNNLDNLINYLRVIQTIDPIPDAALEELMTLSGLDLTQLLLKSKLSALLELSKHHEILPLILALSGPDDLLSVQEVYEQKSDAGTYYAMLETIPKNHVLYSSAAPQLFHNTLNSKVPEDDHEKRQRLEKLFRYALDSKFIPEATAFFDILCGGDGMDPKRKNIDGDPEVLIMLAREIFEAKSVQEENLHLKDKNIRLQQQLKRLKKTIPKTKKNESAHPSSSGMFKP